MAGARKRHIRPRVGWLGFLGCLHRTCPEMRRIRNAHVMPNTGTGCNISIFDKWLGQDEAWAIGWLVNYWRSLDMILWEAL